MLQKNCSRLRQNVRAYEVEDLDVIETLIQLHDGGFLDPQALIAIERNSRVKEISWPAGYVEVRQKNYGQATIYYANFQSENG